MRGIPSFGSMRGMSWLCATIRTEAPGRALLGLIVVAAAALSAAGAAVMLTPTRVEVAPALSAGDLLVGERSELAVAVHNAHLWSSAEIASVGTTCGCTRVVSFDRAIPPRSEGVIRLEVLPGAFERTVGAEITVSTGDGRSAVCRVEGSAVPPFEGWPSEAAALREGQELVVPLAEPYAGRFLSVEVYAGAPARSLPAQLESEPGRIRVPVSLVAPDETLELVVTIDGDVPQRWAGPIRVRPAGSPSALLETSE